MLAKGERAMGDCELRKASGTDAECDGNTCIYWRMVEHLDTGQVPDGGCAIRYFSLLEGGDEVAEWLLSVKRRLAGESAA